MWAGIIPRLLGRSHADACPQCATSRHRRPASGADEVEVVTGNLLDARSIRRADRRRCRLLPGALLTGPGRFLPNSTARALVFATQVLRLDHVIYLGGLPLARANINGASQQPRRVGILQSALHAGVPRSWSGHRLRLGVVRDGALPDRNASHRRVLRFDLNEVQPAAIRDVLSYPHCGAGALARWARRRHPGSDRLTFKQMMVRRGAGCTASSSRAGARLPCRWDWRQLRGW